MQLSWLYLPRKLQARFRDKEEDVVIGSVMHAFDIQGCEVRSEPIFDLTASRILKLGN